MVPVVKRAGGDDLVKIDPFHGWHGRFASAAEGLGGSRASRHFEKHRHDLRKFVNEHLPPRERGREHEIGKVMGLARIRRATGHDLKGYRATVDNEKLQHALNSHGSASQEARRGQEALTADDLQHIPEIMARGSVSHGRAGQASATGLIFEHTIAGTRYHAVAIIRPKTKTLAFVTMWKKRR
jgi:hypothetical protein